MKKFFSFLLAMLLAFSVFMISGCSNKEEADSNVDGDGTPYAIITVKDYGTIEVQLAPDVAPITVENFISLANSGFYNGLTFQRIISGFMIQGGDPNKDCTGGSDQTIKGEFSANGVENNISHVRGVISMARSQKYDSASSQFFIMHADATYLDGNYAAFGSVTSGMDVVDKICAYAEQNGYSGVLPESAQPVIESIVIEYRR